MPISDYNRPSLRLEVETARPLHLLDEPTSALDASVQAEVLNLPEDVRRWRKLTF